MVQKVFGIREAKNGTETDEVLQIRTDGHQRIFAKNVEDAGGSKDKREKPRERSIGGS